MRGICIPTMQLHEEALPRSCACAHARVCVCVHARKRVCARVCTRACVNTCVLVKRVSQAPVQQLTHYVHV